MHFAFKMTSFGKVFAMVWAGSWSCDSDTCHDSHGGVPCLSPANIKQCTRGDLLKGLAIFRLSSETLIIWYEFMKWRVILTRWYQDSELTSVSKELLVADFWLWNHSKPFLNGRTSQQVFLSKKSDNLLVENLLQAMYLGLAWIIAIPANEASHRAEITPLQWLNEF